MDKYEKLYNEALEKAQKVTQAGGDVAMEIVQYIFPELRESEDERIRKTLIDALKISKTVGELKFRLPEPTREEAIAWLEKQKEQKFAEWKPQPESLEALMYAIEGKWEMIKPTSYLSRRLEDLYEGLVNTYNVDETHMKPKPNFDTHWENGSIVCEQEEQKPAEWNEEDEKMFEKINGSLNGLKTYINEHPSMSQAYKESVTKGIERQQDWLKSLRPVSKESLQSHWKPSEEQMKALKEVAYSIVGTGTQTDVYLVQLYEQLKKL